MSVWSTNTSLIDQRAGGRCEAALSPACGQWATHLHNRAPGHPVDPATHLWVCDRCNIWVANHHHEAKQLGWHLNHPDDAETVPLRRHGLAVHLGADGTMWPTQEVAS